MSDPRRLLDDPDATPLERALLASWEREQPTNAARERTLVALGVGAGAAITAAAGSASAAAGGSIAPKAVGGVLLLKWWAISTVAIGVVAGGAAVVVHERKTETPVVAASAPVVASVAPIVPSPIESALPVPSATPTVDVPHVVPHPKPTSSSLADEVAKLDRARIALDGNDPSKALREADEYIARYPHGTFVQEAEVLRVQALLAKGDRAGAERAGNQFLAAHPTSPHATRVRGLLASP